MAWTITIHFPPDQAEEFILIDRLRNFGETVFLFIRDSRLGEVNLNEVDAATAYFSVRGVRGRKVRRVLQWIDEEAARQHLRIHTEASNHP